MVVISRKHMINPQIENGRTEIANEIMEALAGIRISGEEWQVLCTILRKTYGWHKKGDVISLSQFHEATGFMKRPSIVRAIKKLLAKKLIFVSYNANKNGNSYSFNKHYDQWQPLAKKLTVSNFVNQPLAKKLHTKAYTTKANYIYIGIFDFWNDQKVMHHRQCDEALIRAIKAKVEQYSVEDIKKAISNYAMVYHGEQYYFHHQYSLIDFLTRKGNFIRWLEGDTDNWLQKEIRSQPQYSSPDAVAYANREN
jgi:phage replication O-like protein O